MTSVTLYYCILSGDGFDDARDRYQAARMRRVGDTSLWEASLPITPGNSGDIYWYVEARDIAMGLESAATTLLQKSPPVVIKALAE